jgi:hypothetical protein
MADLVTVGRLQPVGFAKRGAVPTSPIVAGTIIAPNLWPRYIPPFEWNPEAPPLESTAHDGTAELPAQIAPGPRMWNAKKLNVYLQPNHVIGNLMMAALGKDTITGDGISDPSHHNFERDQVAQLPVYDFWADGGAAPKGKQEAFTAGMCGEFDLFSGQAELHRVETAFSGLYYVGTGLAISPAAQYTGERPLAFSTTEMFVDDIAQNDIQVFHVKINNKVVAEHALYGDTTDPRHIWSEGIEVSLDVEEILTNVDEYNRFSLQSTTLGKIMARITAQETFVEGALPTTAYQFIVGIPAYYYKTGVKSFPDGVVRGVFTGGGLKGSMDLGSGATLYSLTNRSIGIQYRNGSPTPY